MITSNLVVEGVPGNPHHHHHHHHHHPHHHALAAAAGHPIHNFSAIHHLNSNAVTSASHLMSATTFAENSFLKAAAAAAANGSLLPTPNEFLRPLPKPAPIIAARYNGVTNTLNGSIKSRHSGKYPDASDVPGPVNLVHQLKETASSSDSAHVTSGYNIYSSPRLYPPPGPSSYPHFPPPQPPPPTIQSGPYGSLYPPGPFTPMLQRDTRSTHLLQLSQYPDSNTPILKSPPTSNAAAVVTSAASTTKNVFETPPPPPPPPPSPSDTQNNRAEKRPFKVPSGKEGSLKHRLLSRPETRVQKKVSSTMRNCSVSTLLPPPSTVSSTPSLSNGVGVRVTSPTESTPTLPQAPPPPVITTTMVTTTTVSSSSGTTGNGTVLNNFNRGSLIRLANGDLKKVEDMQAEDFLSSAQKSSTTRFDPSTVVRICESANSKGIFATLTLSYGEKRQQVDYETPVEHPYFVFQHGWSSCAPEKTFKQCGLRCRQLQVGDVCASLSRKCSQQSGSQTPRKSGAPKSESTASKLRHQGHGHKEQHAMQAQVPSRNDYQTSNGVRVDAANGAAGGGDGGATTLSYKKNDLRFDNCNENNGLRFNHTNGDSNIDSNSSSSGGSSCNISNSSNVSISSNISGSVSNTYNNGMNGGMNFTINLMNRPAADDEGKKYEKSENDTNNNSNNMSDKYGGLPNKKKRRWSAPDQITDEYQNSPLSSPQSLSSVLSSASSVGSDVALSARNI